MKVEIRLTKIFNAGMYEIVSKSNGITDDMIYKLGSGQPYYYARLEAERLAVILNCDLYENDKLIRETINKIEGEVKENG
jgi:hypothetical protein